MLAQKELFDMSPWVGAMAHLELIASAHHVEVS